MPDKRRHLCCIITAVELRYGCAKKGSAKLLANVEAILGSVQVLALDVPTDAGYDSIRASLETTGKPIRQKDLLIAAYTCAAGAVLITANTSELIRVLGLHVEDWLA